MRRETKIVACLALASASLISVTQAQIITNIAMVPRLTIAGTVGVSNRIEYTADLGMSNWLVLTNLVVAQTPYVFVDASAPPAPRRFYRVLAPTNSVAPPANMALIPAGAFTMGDTFNEGDASERPTHTVYVSAFYMDQFEVSKALWDEVYQWAIVHGYSFDRPGDTKATNHPVQYVSWYDAVKWCNARSEKDGRVPAYYTNATQTTVYRAGQFNTAITWVNWNAGYRLPTEAEWEKAARGSANGHRFPWSNADEISHSQANYNAGGVARNYDLSFGEAYHPLYAVGGFPYTSPVGSFAANGYVLYDMAGNVSEWCWDRYGSTYYSSSPGSDPRGSVTGSTRVVRGGSWQDYALYCRSASHYNVGPDGFAGWLGFRCVLPAGLP